MHPVKAITQIATVARGISGASLGRNKAQIGRAHV